MEVKTRAVRGGEWEIMAVELTAFYAGRRMDFFWVILSLPSTLKPEKKSFWQ